MTVSRPTLSFSMRGLPDCSARRLRSVRIVRDRIWLGEI
jgi:hypothetical protein